MLANQRPLKAQSSHWRAETVVLVPLLGISHARVLPHRPQAAAVHRGLHTARVGKISGDIPDRGRNPTPQDPWACRGDLRRYEKRSLGSGGELPAGCGLGRLEFSHVVLPFLALGSPASALAFLFTLQNELSPNQANDTVKHTASSSRPCSVARPDWYLPYARMPAMAPTPAIARNVNPVTSSQSWCRSGQRSARLPESRQRAPGPSGCAPPYWRPHGKPPSFFAAPGRRSLVDHHS